MMMPKVGEIWERLSVRTDGEGGYEVKVVEVNPLEDYVSFKLVDTGGLYSFSGSTWKSIMRKVEQ